MRRTKYVEYVAFSRKLSHRRDLFAPAVTCRHEFLHHFENVRRHALFQNQRGVEKAFDVRVKLAKAFDGGNNAV